MDLLVGVRYKPGDQVKVNTRLHYGHCRTPGYVRGKVGRVVALYGEFPNPESLAYGGPGLPRQPLYQVEFEQVHVWPDYHGSPVDKLRVDLYQHWLDPA